VVRRLSAEKKRPFGHFLAVFPLFVLTFPSTARLRVSFGFALGRADSSVRALSLHPPVGPMQNERLSPSFPFLTQTAKPGKKTPSLLVFA